MPKKRLVFVDESGFDEFLYRQHARSPRGEKIMAEVSGRRFDSESVVAAKRGKDILAPFGYKGTCDTALFNFLLKNSAGSKIKKKTSRYLGQRKNTQIRENKNDYQKSSMLSCFSSNLLS